MTTEVDPAFIAETTVPGQVDISVVPLDQLTAEVVAQLQRRRADPVDIARVQHLIALEWRRYDDAPVRTYLPVLVRRAVLDQVLGRHR